MQSEPKIILFFTEAEYDALNLKLEVNKSYDVTITDRTIKFLEEENPDAPAN
jgi:hypothetical protein